SARPTALRQPPPGFLRDSSGPIGPGLPRIRHGAGSVSAPASPSEPAVRRGRWPHTRTKARRSISPTRSFPLPGFANFENLVHSHIRQLLHLFARPADLNAVHRCGFAQPKMQAPIALREEAKGATRLSEILPATGVDLHQGAEAVPVALGSLQIEREPVIPGLIPIMQEKTAVPHRGHQDVHAPV